MSADPSVVAGREPGWFVVTDQGVVLSARFAHKPDALAAHAAVVAGMRRELAREGRPGRFTAERVRAVQVRYGLVVGAWNGFQPLPRSGGVDQPGAGSGSSASSNATISAVPDGARIR